MDAPMDGVSDGILGILPLQTGVKKKVGVLYLATIPPMMTVTKIREYFNTYSGGKVGRMFLQEKSKKMKKQKAGQRFYTEGWVEILSKKAAKEIAQYMNNQPIGGSKKSKWFDYIWNIKYLPGFKWAHLNERLRYERAVRQDRLRTEVALAKKEANFYLDNVEKSERLTQRRQRLEGSGKPQLAAGRPGLPFNQRLTTAEILKKKGMTEGREDRLGVMRTVGLFGNKNAPPGEGE